MADGRYGLGDRHQRHGGSGRGRRAGRTHVARRLRRALRHVLHSCRMHRPHRQPAPRRLGAQGRRVDGDGRFPGERRPRGPKDRPRAHRRRGPIESVSRHLRRRPARFRHSSRIRPRTAGDRAVVRPPAAARRSADLWRSEWAAHAIPPQRIPQARLSSLSGAPSIVQSATGSEVTVYYGSSRDSRDGSRSWNEEKRRNAAAFKTNRVPVLVATKAFGMRSGGRLVRRPRAVTGRPRD